MTEHNHVLDVWYRHAARTPGFIGAALQAQRIKVFMTQEQQRSLMGILERKYDHLWLHLQAMPMPREEQFATDLQRIVEKIVTDEGNEATIESSVLETLIRTGLE